MNRFLLRGLFPAGLLFYVVLSLAHPAIAEEKRPFHTMFSCVIADGALADGLNHLFVDKAEGKPFVDFPSEINLDAGFRSLTVTDGNDMWTLMSSGVRHFGFYSLGEGRFVSSFDTEKLDDKNFRDRLLATTLVKTVFGETDADLFMRKGRLFLVSETFPLERLDELNPEQKWKTLLANHRFVCLSEYQKWRLYPELPPEKPNEGSFLQSIRKERGKADFVKDDSVVSALLTLDWTEDDYLAVYKIRMKEDAEHTRHLTERQKARESSSCKFSGFIAEADQENTAFYRWYPNDPFDRVNYVLYGGFSPANSEDQPEEGPPRTITFMGNFLISSEPIETIQKEQFARGWKLLRDNNVAFALYAFPYYNRTPPGVLAFQPINDALAECCQAVLDALRTVRIGTKSVEQSQPIDLGMVTDDDTITLMAALPPGMKMPDTFPVTDFVAKFNRLPEHDYKLRKEKGRPLDVLTSFQLVTNDIATIDGIRYSLGQIVMRTTSDTESKTKEIPLVAFLSAVKSNELYVLQFTTQGLAGMFSEEIPVLDMNDFKEQKFASFRRRVEDSLHAKQTNRPAAENFVRLNWPGYNASLTERFAENEHSYTMTVKRDSLNLLALLPSLLGTDLLGEMLPK